MNNALKGSNDLIYARKATKYLLMMYGFSIDEIDNMEEDDVVEFSTFIEKVEEIRIKKLAYEIAKVMWGKTNK